MTTALKLATLAAVPVQSAPSQAQAQAASSSAGADTGVNPSFSQVLAGQSGSSAVQNPKASNNPPQKAQQAPQQAADASSAANGTQAADQTVGGTSLDNSEPTGKRSAKNDNQDGLRQNAENIALNTLDNTAVAQALPMLQTPQQITGIQKNAQTAPSLPQQALEIAAQVAAVQTQVANRQPLQAGASGNATAVMGAVPTAKSAKPVALQAAATTLPAAASQLQNTGSSAAEPAVAATATAAMTQAAQPAAPAQAQPQNARLAATDKGLNPVTSAIKQSAKATRADTAKIVEEASMATQPPLQVPQAAPQLVIPPTPQHDPALATAQTGANLASLTASSSVSGSPSSVNAAPSQVQAVLSLTATPVGSAQWNTDLGRQMVLLSSNTQTGNQTAELRLDPPNLGPLHVTINLTDGVASAAFVSAHAVVRQALESAMPQLQTAFEQAGLSLGQTSVGDQNAQSSERQASNSRSSRSAAVQIADGGNTVAAALQVSAVRNANALVDTFA